MGTGSTPHRISPSMVVLSMTSLWTWTSYPASVQFHNPLVKDYPESLKRVLILAHTQDSTDPQNVLTFILLIIHILFSLEITIFSLGGNRLLLFSALCIWIYTHVHILVCHSSFRVPGNMCSRRMERSHLHPPCIFSPGSKLLGNEFPKGKKKFSLRTTGPHGHPWSASAPVYRKFLCWNISARIKFESCVMMLA